MCIALKTMTSALLFFQLELFISLFSSQLISFTFSSSQWLCFFPRAVFHWEVSSGLSLLTVQGNDLVMEKGHSPLSAVLAFPDAESLGWRFSCSRLCHFSLECVIIVLCVGKVEGHCRGAELRASTEQSSVGRLTWPGSQLTSHSALWAVAQRHGVGLALVEPLLIVHEAQGSIFCTNKQIYENETFWFHLFFPS